MRRRFFCKKNYLNIIAAALVLTFMAQDLLWAGAGSEVIARPSVGLSASAASSAIHDAAPATIAELAAEPARVPLPAGGQALLRSHHAGDNGKLILHIQDAHGNPQAQKNLAAVISFLNDRYPDLRLIAVEGGEGDASLDPIRSVAPAKVWKQVAPQMLRDGLIAGEEFLNLTSERPIALWGVEETSLYKEDLSAYAKVLRLQPNVDPMIRRIRIAAEGLKERLYPQPLLDREKFMRAAKQNDPQSMWDYGTRAEAFRFLPVALQPTASEYPTIAVWQELRRDPSAEESPALEREMLALCAALPADHPDAAVWRSGSLRDPSSVIGLWARIRLAAEAEGVHAGPRLTKYLMQLDQAAGMDLARLDEELDRAEQNAYETLLTDPAAKQLYRVDRYVELLDRALRLRMDVQDVQAMAVGMRQYPMRHLLAWLNRELADRGLEALWVWYHPAAEPALRQVRRFYDLAGRRDEAFVRETERAMESRGETAAILIAGGYHSSRLTELLSARGYSIAVIAPMTDQETDWEAYERVLLSTDNVRKNRGPARAEPGTKTTTSGSMIRAATARGALGARLAKMAGPKRPGYTDVLEWLKSADAGARLSRQIRQEALDAALSLLPQIITADGDGTVFFLGHVGTVREDGSTSVGLHLTLKGEGQGPPIGVGYADFGIGPDHNAFLVGGVTGIGANMGVRGRNRIPGFDDPGINAIEVRPEYRNRYSGLGRSLMAAALTVSEKYMESVSGDPLLWRGAFKVSATRSSAGFYAGVENGEVSKGLGFERIKDQGVAADQLIFRLGPGWAEATQPIPPIGVKVKSAPIGSAEADRPGARMSAANRIPNRVHVNAAITWLNGQSSGRMRQLAKLVDRYQKVPGMGHVLERLGQNIPSNFNDTEQGPDAHSLEDKRRRHAVSEKRRRHTRNGILSELVALDRFLSLHPAGVPILLSHILHKEGRDLAEIDAFVWMPTADGDIERGLHVLEVKSGRPDSKHLRDIELQLSSHKKALQFLWTAWKFPLHMTLAYVHSDMAGSTERPGEVNFDRRQPPAMLAVYGNPPEFTVEKSADDLKLSVDIGLLLRPVPTMDEIGPEILRQVVDSYRSPWLLEHWGRFEAFRKALKGVIPHDRLKSDPEVLGFWPLTGPVGMPRDLLETPVHWNYVIRWVRSDAMRRALEWHIKKLGDPGASPAARGTAIHEIRGWSADPARPKEGDIPQLIAKAQQLAPELAPSPKPVVSRERALRIPRVPLTKVVTDPKLLDIDEMSRKGESVVELLWDDPDGAVQLTVDPEKNVDGETYVRIGTADETIILVGFYNQRYNALRIDQWNTEKLNADQLALLSSILGHSIRLIIGPVEMGLGSGHVSGTVAYEGSGGYSVHVPDGLVVGPYDDDPVDWFDQQAWTMHAKAAGLSDEDFQRIAKTARLTISKAAGARMSGTGDPPSDRTITLEAYEEDVRISLLNGTHIQKIGTQVEQPGEHEVAGGLTPYNTRPLSPTALRILGALYTGKTSNLAGKAPAILELGHGAGYSVAQTRVEAERAGVEPVIHSVGLSPIAPHLRLMANAARIQTWLSDAHTQGHQQVQDIVSVYGSNSLEAAFFLQALGYAVFERTTEPVVDLQIIGDYMDPTVLPPLTYDLIRDDRGALWYPALQAVQGDGQQFVETLRKTFELLAREGILHVMSAQALLETRVDLSLGGDLLWVLQIGRDENTTLQAFAVRSDSEHAQRIRSLMPPGGDKNLWKVDRNTDVVKVLFPAAARMALERSDPFEKYRLAGEWKYSLTLEEWELLRAYNGWWAQDSRPIHPSNTKIANAEERFMERYMKRYMERLNKINDKGLQPNPRKNKNEYSLFVARTVLALEILLQRLEKIQGDPSKGLTASWLLDEPETPYSTLYTVLKHWPNESSDGRAARIVLGHAYGIGRHRSSIQDLLKDVNASLGEEGRETWTQEQLDDRLATFTAEFKQKLRDYEEMGRSYQTKAPAELSGKLKDQLERFRQTHQPKMGKKRNKQPTLPDSLEADYSELHAYLMNLPDKSGPTVADILGLDREIFKYKKNRGFAKTYGIKPGKKGTKLDEPIPQKLAKARKKGDYFKEGDRIHYTLAARNIGVSETSMYMWVLKNPELAETYDINMPPPRKKSPPEIESQSLILEADQIDPLNANILPSTGDGGAGSRMSDAERVWEWTQKLDNIKYLMRPPAPEHSGLQTRPLEDIETYEYERANWKRRVQKELFSKLNDNARQTTLRIKSVLIDSGAAPEWAHQNPRAFNRALTNIVDHLSHIFTAAAENAIDAYLEQSEDTKSALDAEGRVEPPLRIEGHVRLVGNPDSRRLEIDIVSNGKRLWTSDGTSKKHGHGYARIGGEGIGVNSMRAEIKQIGGQLMLLSRRDEPGAIVRMTIPLTALGNYFDRTYRLGARMSGVSEQGRGAWDMWLGHLFKTKNMPSNPQVASAAINMLVSINFNNSLTPQQLAEMQWKGIESATRAGIPSDRQNNIKPMVLALMSLVAKEIKILIGNADRGDAVSIEVLRDAGRHAARIMPRSMKENSPYGISPYEPDAILSFGQLLDRLKDISKQTTAPLNNDRPHLELMPGMNGVAHLYSLTNKAHQVWVVDKSPFIEGAYEETVKILGLEDQVRFIRGDVFDLPRLADPTTGKKLDEMRFGSVGWRNVDSYLLHSARIDGERGIQELDDLIQFILSHAQGHIFEKIPMPGINRSVENFGEVYRNTLVKRAALGSLGLMVGASDSQSELTKSGWKLTVATEPTHQNDGLFVWTSPLESRSASGSTDPSAARMAGVSFSVNDGIEPIATRKGSKRGELRLYDAQNLILASLNDQDAYMNLHIALKHIEYDSEYGESSDAYEVKTANHQIPPLTLSAYQGASDYARQRAMKLYLVVDEQNMVVGFAQGLPDSEKKDSYWLHALYVVRSAQGNGVGSFLLDEIFAKARKAEDLGQKFRTIDWRSSDWSIGFYKEYLTRRAPYAFDGDKFTVFLNMTEGPEDFAARYPVILRAQEEHLKEFKSNPNLVYAPFDARATSPDVSGARMSSVQETEWTRWVVKQAGNTGELTAEKQLELVRLAGCMLHIMNLSGKWDVDMNPHIAKNVYRMASMWDLKYEIPDESAVDAIKDSYKALWNKLRKLNRDGLFGDVGAVPVLKEAGRQAVLDMGGYVENLKHPYGLVDSTPEAPTLEFGELLSTIEDSGVVPDREILHHLEVGPGIYGIIHIRSLMQKRPRRLRLTFVDPSPFVIGALEKMVEITGINKIKDYDITFVRSDIEDVDLTKSINPVHSLGIRNLLAYIAASWNKSLQLEDFMDWMLSPRTHPKFIFDKLISLDGEIEDTSGVTDAYGKSTSLPNSLSGAGYWELLGSPRRLDTMTTNPEYPLTWVPKGMVFKSPKGARMADGRVITNTQMIGSGVFDYKADKAARKWEELFGSAAPAVSRFAMGSDEKYKHLTRVRANAIVSWDHRRVYQIVFEHPEISGETVIYIKVHDKVRDGEDSDQITIHEHTIQERASSTNPPLAPESAIFKSESGVHFLAIRDAGGPELMAAVIQDWIFSMESEKARAEVLQFVEAFAEALARLHWEAGVVHRDLMFPHRSLNFVYRRDHKDPQQRIQFIDFHLSSMDGAATDEMRLAEKEKVISRIQNIIWSSNTLKLDLTELGWDAGKKFERIYNKVMFMISPSSTLNGENSQGFARSDVSGARLSLLKPAITDPVVSRQIMDGSNGRTDSDGLSAELKNTVSKWNDVSGPQDSIGPRRSRMLKALVSWVGTEIQWNEKAGMLMLESVQEFMLYAMLDPAYEVRKTAVEELSNIFKKYKKSGTLDQVLEHLKNPSLSLTDRDWPKVANGMGIDEKRAYGEKRFAILALIGNLSRLKVPQADEWILEQANREILAWGPEPSKRAEKIWKDGAEPMVLGDALRPIGLVEGLVLEMSRFHRLTRDGRVARGSMDWFQRDQMPALMTLLNKSGHARLVDVVMRGIKEVQPESGSRGWRQHYLSFGRWEWAIVKDKFDSLNKLKRPFGWLWFNKSVSREEVVQNDVRHIKENPDQTFASFDGRGPADVPASGARMSRAERINRAMDAAELTIQKMQALQDLIWSLEYLEVRRSKEDALAGLRTMSLKYFADFNGRMEELGDKQLGRFVADIMEERFGLNQKGELVEELVNRHDILPEMETSLVEMETSMVIRQRIFLLHHLRDEIQHQDSPVRRELHDRLLKLAEESSRRSSRDEGDAATEAQIVSRARSLMLIMAEMLDVYTRVARKAIERDAKAREMDRHLETLESIRQAFAAMWDLSVMTWMRVPEDTMGMFRELDEALSGSESERRLIRRQMTEYLSSPGSTQADLIPPELLDQNTLFEDPDEAVFDRESEYRRNFGERWDIEVGQWGRYRQAIQLWLGVHREGRGLTVQELSSEVEAHHAVLTAADGSSETFMSVVASSLAVLRQASRMRNGLKSHLSRLGLSAISVRDLKDDLAAKWDAAIAEAEQGLAPLLAALQFSYRARVRSAKSDWEMDGLPFFEKIPLAGYSSPGITEETNTIGLDQLVLETFEDGHRFDMLSGLAKAIEARARWLRLVNLSRQIKGDPLTQNGSLIEAARDMIEHDRSLDDGVFSVLANDLARLVETPANDVDKAANIRSRIQAYRDDSAMQKYLRRSGALYLSELRQVGEMGGRLRKMLKQPQIWRSTGSSAESTEYRQIVLYTNQLLDLLKANAMVTSLLISGDQLDDAKAWLDAAEHLRPAVITAARSLGPLVMAAEPAGEAHAKSSLQKIIDLERILREEEWPRITDSAGSKKGEAVKAVHRLRARVSRNLVWPALLIALGRAPGKDAKQSLLVRVLNAADALNHAIEAPDIRQGRDPAQIREHAQDVLRGMIGHEKQKLKAFGGTPVSAEGGDDGKMLGLILSEKDLGAEDLAGMLGAYETSENEVFPIHHERAMLRLIVLELALAKYDHRDDGPSGARMADVSAANQKSPAAGFNRSEQDVANLVDQELLPWLNRIDLLSSSAASRIGPESVSVRSYGDEWAVSVQIPDSLGAGTIAINLPRDTGRPVDLGPKLRDLKPGVSDLIMNALERFAGSLGYSQMRVKVLITGSDIFFENRGWKVQSKYPRAQLDLASTRSLAPNEPKKREQILNTILRPIIRTNEQELRALINDDLPKTGDDFRGIQVGIPSAPTSTDDHAGAEDPWLYTAYQIALDLAQRRRQETAVGDVALKSGEDHQMALQLMDNAAFFRTPAQRERAEKYGARMSQSGMSVEDQISLVNAAVDKLPKSIVATDGYGVEVEREFKVRHEVHMEGNNIVIGLDLLTDEDGVQVGVGYADFVIGIKEQELTGDEWGYRAEMMTRRREKINGFVEPGLNAIVIESRYRRRYKGLGRSLMSMALQVTSEYMSSMAQTTDAREADNPDKWKGEFVVFALTKSIGFYKRLGFDFTSDLGFPAGEGHFRIGDGWNAELPELPEVEVIDRRPSAARMAANLDRSERPIYQPFNKVSAEEGARMAYVPFGRLDQLEANRLAEAMDDARRGGMPQGPVPVELTGQYTLVPSGARAAASSEDVTAVTVSPDMNSGHLNYLERMQKETMNIRAALGTLLGSGTVSGAAGKLRAEVIFTLRPVLGPSAAADQRAMDAWRAAMKLSVLGVSERLAQEGIHLAVNYDTSDPVLLRHLGDDFRPDPRLAGVRIEVVSDTAAAFEGELNRLRFYAAPDGLSEGAFRLMNLEGIGLVAGSIAKLTDGPSPSALLSTGDLLMVGSAWTILANADGDGSGVGLGWNADTAYAVLIGKADPETRQKYSAKARSLGARLSAWIQVLQTALSTARIAA